MRIRTIIILAYLLIAVLMGVASYVIIGLSQDSLETQIGKSSIFLSTEIMDKVNRHLFGLIQQLQFLTGDSQLQKELASSNNEFSKMPDVERYIDGMDTAWISAPRSRITPFMQDIIQNEASAELRGFTSFYKEKYGYPLYGEIFVTNRYGANVAQTGKTSDYRQNDEEWWQIAREKGIYIGHVGYDESADVYSIDIGIGIHDKAGNFIGAAKAVLNVQEIFSIMEAISLETPYKDLHIKLVADDGTLIYAQRDFEFLKNVSNEDYFRMATGQQGYFLGEETLNSVTEEEFISYVKFNEYGGIPNPGWTLFLQYDADTALAPVTELRNALLKISLVIIGLSLAMGLFVSRIISEPLEKLTRIMDELSRGDMRAGIDSNLLKQKNEIGKLAQAFDRILVSLKLCISDLKKGKK